MNERLDLPHRRLPHRRRRRFLAIVMVSVAGIAGPLPGAAPVSAATVTWTGGAGTSDWFDGANWDSGAPPLVADEIVIPAGMRNSPASPIPTSE